MKENSDFFKFLLEIDYNSKKKTKPKTFLRLLVGLKVFVSFSLCLIYILCSQSK